jgi:hypothetical protein
MGRNGTQRRRVPEITPTVAADMSLQGPGSTCRRDRRSWPLTLARTPVRSLKEADMTMVRKCEKCGSIDRRATWSSPEEAAKSGAFDTWSCPMCAWPEFDLVEAEQEVTANA